MFEIGWTELMLIGIVALIVIGPKDLPDMFRTMGRFTAKLRAMSRDFSRAMETAAKESGVNDLATDLKTMTSAKSMGLDAVKDAATKFEKWDPLKGAAKPAAVPAAAAAPLGPAMQALADQQAAQKARSAEVAEQLRATGVQAAAQATAALAIAAPAAAVAPEAVVAAKAPRKPRAPRAKPAKDA